jgi:hypothetical protein
MHTRHCAFALSVLTGLVGCSSSPEEHVVLTSDPIATEQTGGIAEGAWRRYARDPIANRFGYAVAQIGGCTGTMIGPEVLMTAAHCGNSDTVARFTSYPYGGAARDEYFDCKLLLNTWPDSDLVLHRCTSPVAGGGAGVYYGYVDLDPTEPFVGQNVFSLWRNPIVDQGIDSAVLFSIGSVASTGTKLWGSGPLLSNEPLAITTTTWSAPGGSGSAQANEATGRLLIGPTSTGVVDGAGRNSLSMKTYLDRATVSGRTEDGVGTSGIHVGTLAAAGLTPADYLGAVDKNRNYLFDVQEDVERHFGEKASLWYHLAFDSARSNAMWDPSPYANVSFDSTLGEAVFSVTTDARVDVLRHPRLSLAPGLTYRIGLQVRLSALTPGASLRLVAGTPGFEAEEVIADDVAADFKDVAVRVTLPAAPQRGGIALRVDTGGSRASVAGVVHGVTIVTETAPSQNTFDEHGMRMAWTDASTLLPALAVPVSGAGSNGINANWAGLVVRHPARPPDADWPLATRDFALPADATWPGHPGKWYSACFDAWIPLAPLGVRARVVLTDGESTADMSFVPESTRSTFCTGPFQPHRAGSWLKFGFASDSRLGAYFVDTVVVTDVPCRPSAACDADACGRVADGCGGTLSCGGCGRGAHCAAGYCSGACCTGGCHLGTTCSAKTCSCVTLD